MIHILIIDDEHKARNILHHYLVENIQEDMDIRQAASVDAALSLLQEFTPDIVFLDVEMPVRNGFDFLSEVKSPAFDIIFTTAFNQYAIQAIRFSALDYLLKPIDPDELKTAVQRHLEHKATTREKEELYQNLVQNLGKKDIRDFKIAVTSTEGAHFFMIDDIIRIEADSSYAHIVLKDGKRFTASKTLKYFEEMLEEYSFLRVHKSHLINPAHIRQINADHSMATMTDGSQVEISRRKKDEVKNLIKPG
jgi:two-component system, LytTR family, response regulator